jgi:phenylpyruvate tautomerase PptA (4-oxalocrotonate tautomerase family)
MIAEGIGRGDRKARIAEEITRIHCETTGAPPAFVHAFFVEMPAAQLPASKQVVVLGSIRAGRTPEQKERLTVGISRAIAGIETIPEDAISVTTVDVPARWVMEGGAIMPEPGEEDAWLARHA